MANVGRVIRRLCADRDWSGADLARCAGVTQQTVSNCMNNKHFYTSFGNLEKILAAFDLDFDRFVRMVAIDWNGSPADEARLRLLEDTLKLSEDQLWQLIFIAEVRDRARQGEGHAASGGIWEPSRYAIGAPPSDPPSGDNAEDPLTPPSKARRIS